MLPVKLRYGVLVMPVAAPELVAAYKPPCLTGRKPVVAPFPSGSLPNCRSYCFRRADKLLFALDLAADLIEPR